MINDVLKIDEKVFYAVMRRHKKALAGLRFCEQGSKEFTWKIVVLENTGQELALAYSRIKCEKCGATEKLQFHHLIMRPVKEFTDFFKYETQRKYWANILVLCGACHQEVHTSMRQFPNHKPEIDLYIKPKLIEYVRKKYKIV